MNKRAIDHVNEVRNEIDMAKTNLQQACGKAEKQENKMAIENAISSLENACEALGNYRD